MNMSTKARLALQVAVTCSLLAACTHTTPVVATAPFPKAPADVTAPLPTMSQLPPGAGLKDILQAHLADAQAFAELKAEVQTWRDWYADQKAAWERKR